MHLRNSEKWNTGSILHSFFCTAVFYKWNWRGNVTCCGPRCAVWYGVWSATCYESYSTAVDHISVINESWLASSEESALSPRSHLEPAEFSPQAVALFYSGFLPASRLLWPKVFMHFFPARCANQRFTLICGKRVLILRCYASSNHLLPLI
jgi:hypothetical protein